MELIINESLVRFWGKFGRNGVKSVIVAIKWFQVQVGIDRFI